MPNPIQILIVLFYFAGLPMLIGVALNCSIKENGMSSYLRGYIWYFAIYHVLGTLVKYMMPAGMLGSAYSRVMGVLTAVMGVMALFAIAIGVATKQIDKPGLPDPEPKGIVILLIELGMMAASILVLKPHWNDLTEENIFTILRSGQTGELHDMLYVGPIVASYMNQYTMVRVFLPLCMLPFFYQAYRYIADQVFGEHREKSSRFFLLVVYLFYICEVTVPGYLGLQPFLNIWNPVTIAVSILIPLFYVELQKRNVTDLVAIAVAMQMMIKEAWMYCVLIIIITGVVTIIRKRMRKAEDVLY